MAVKLRKSPPNSPPKAIAGSSAPAQGWNFNDMTTSRTMMFAQAPANVPNPWSTSLSGRKSTSDSTISSRLARPTIVRREDVGPKPITAATQYWAMRALTAEALLSARETRRHTETRSLSYSESVKRYREISSLAKEHQERHAGLERLVIVLVASLCSLVALVIYLATHYTRQAARHPWSLPSHFTIPILSPFTSVVEHETSVIGTKTITVVLLLMTALAYLTLRHRISQAFG